MKRIVSIICLAALLVSVLSMTAFAEGNESYSFNKGKTDPAMLCTRNLATPRNRWTRAVTQILT